MKTYLLFASFFLRCTFVSQTQWQPDVILTNDPGNSQTDGLPDARFSASGGDSVYVT